jgi:hypothetical protein
MSRKWIIVMSAFAALDSEIERGEEIFFASRPFLQDFSIPPEILSFPEEEREHDIRLGTFILNFQEALEEWDTEANPPVKMEQANFFDDTPLPDDKELFKG